MRWHDLPTSDFVIENRESVKYFYCQGSGKNNTSNILICQIFSEDFWWFTSIILIRNEEGYNLTVCIV